ASPARGQGVDPRWSAWRGCWKPSDESDAASRYVCVVPDSASATVLTFVRGAIVTRDTIVPSASPRAIERDGCTGTERVTWAADGGGLFRAAELDCQGGLHQSISEILAIARTGEWIDVQGVSVQERAGVRVEKFR